MRVAMLSPIAWRTPPRHYGPWEQVVSLITEGLFERGVDVTLFATKDSITSAKLHAVCPKGYEEDKEIHPKVWECLHISELFEMGDEFDIIHNHFDFLPLTYTHMTKTPVLTTIHGFSSEKILPVYEKYNGEVFYVSISDADRAPSLDYIATIHHGIDLSNFTFRGEHGNYLLFFGRIHHDKGTKEAIEIAKRFGKKLVIAGIIQDERYFEKEVKPYIDGESVVYVGSVGKDLRDKLLGEAYALVHPINFKEPFGLSVVESMACGTPVVAFNKGSMPEIIINGTTGFLVENVDDAVDALKRVKELDRSFCRKHVEEKFTKDIMVSKYIDVYKKILDLRKREDKRPWGYYEVLLDAKDHKVKRIVVYPKKRLSLQRHKRRSEHWYIVSGKAIVTVDDRVFELSSMDCIDIPKGALHRIENVCDSNLIFIEVQKGDYLGEDDIERFEDDYGRV